MLARSIARSDSQLSIWTLESGVRTWVWKADGLAQLAFASNCSKVKSKLERNSIAFSREPAHKS